jgi:hypothetical protein
VRGRGGDDEAVQDDGWIGQPGFNVFDCLKELNLRVRQSEIANARRIDKGDVLAPLYQKPDNESYRALVLGERDFAGSLFHEINKSHSTINLLIGSKKFTEGWNSWRVSTMGLMNVGSTEGSQIIQLFGRGVRLKGYGQNLKRSGRAALPEEVCRPRHIAVLETLNIFGIKADYMAQFREFLEEEGLPPNDERMEFYLPIIRNLGSKRLKTIRLKKTINAHFAELRVVPNIDYAERLIVPYAQRNLTARALQVLDVKSAAARRVK